MGFLVCAVIDYAVVSLSNKVNKFFVLLPEAKQNAYANVTSALGCINSISEKTNSNFFWLSLGPH